MEGLGDEKSSVSAIHPKKPSAIFLPEINPKTPIVLSHRVIQTTTPKKTAKLPWPRGVGAGNFLSSTVPKNWKGKSNLSPGQAIKEEGPNQGLLYRTTYFSDIALNIMEREEAAERIRHHRALSFLEITPGVLVFDQVTLDNHEFSMTLRIRNKSRFPCTFTLSPPKTPIFRLAKREYLESFTIAAGLTASFDIIFQTSSAHAEASKNGASFRDQLGLETNTGKRIHVKLEAIPARPLLSFPDQLDFGTIIKAREHADSGFNSKSCNSTHSGCYTKQFRVRNNAAVPATLRFVLPGTDDSIRISPSSTTLGAAGSSSTPDSHMFTATLNAKADGPACIPIQIEASEKLGGESRSSKTIAPRQFTIEAIANVISHKLILLKADPKLSKRAFNALIPIEDNLLDFGSVFSSQQVAYPVTLRNQSPTPVNWMIMQTSEISPSTVPKELALLPCSDDLDSATAFLVEPSQGFLNPFESIQVQFSFRPVLEVPKTGFKNSREMDAFLMAMKKYRLPMELRIIRPLITAAPGEEPVHLLLTGSGCASHITLSCKQLDFGTIVLGQEQKMDRIILRNGSAMGVSFSFSPIAHFQVTPATGNLKSKGGEVEILVVYNPVHLGNHASKLVCTILSGAEKIKSIPLKCTGYCAAGKASKKSLGDSEDKERSELLLHQNEYTEYIRSLRQAALEKEHKKCKDMQSGIDFSLDNCWCQKLPMLDPHNGLEYEFGWESILGDELSPAVLDLKSYEGKHTAIRLNYSSEDQKIIDGLLHELGENVMYRGRCFQSLTVPVKPYKAPEYKKSSTEKIQKANDRRLSTSDLENLFASDAVLDFGTVSSHSVSRKPLNFVNATHSKQIVIITINDEEGLMKNIDPLEIGSAVQNSNSGVPKQDSHAPGIGTRDIQIFPRSIAIPAMYISGFEFVFCAAAPGLIEEKITYLVNGRYKYKLIVKANVVPAKLHLSEKNLELSVNPQTNANFEKNLTENMRAGRTIRITNPGNHQASYKWLIPQTGDYRNFPLTPAPPSTVKGVNNCTFGANVLQAFPDLRLPGVFGVDPLHGVVPANSFVDVTISYTPGYSAHYTQTLTFQTLDKEYNQHAKNKKVVSAEDITLNGSVAITSPTCVNLPGKLLDFGPLSICFAEQPLKNLNSFNYFGYEDAKTVTPLDPKGKFTLKLQNPSLIAASFFMVEQQKGRIEFTISADHGIIAPGGIFELVITAAPTYPGVVSDELIIHCAGAQPINIPLKAEGVATQLSISVPRNSFFADEVIVGTKCSNFFEIMNHGSTASKLLVDLRGHPEFHLKVDRAESPLIAKSPGDIKKTASSKVDSGNTFNIGHRRKIEAYLGVKKLLAFSKKHPLYNFDSESNSPLQTQAGDLYLVTCEPGENIRLECDFIPQTIQEYDFSIPLQTIGVDAPIFVPIRIQVLASPISLSTTAIDFGNRLIDNVSTTSGIYQEIFGTKYSPKSLTLSNSGHIQLSWKFNSSVIDQSPFKLTPAQGVIEPDGKTNLKIQFCPFSVGKFSQTFYLDFKSNRHSGTMEVTATGNGIEACIVFDPPELFMPIMPLGATSTAVFSIINSGCERSEVIPTFLNQPKNGAWELFFPEGKLLKSDHEPLTVQIKFKSNPMSGSAKFNNGVTSITSKLEFKDAQGRTFYLDVHATSDNSFLTLHNYQYLTKNSHSFVLNGALTIDYERTGSECPNLTESQARNSIIKDDRPFRTPAGIPLRTELECANYNYYLDRVGKRLVKVIEGHLSSSLEGIEFPEVFTRYQGRPLMEFLQSLSGKKIPTSHTELFDNVEQNLKQSLGYYSDILVFLRQNGALIANVKPEFLMLADEYGSVSRKALEKKKADLGIPQYEKQAQYLDQFIANFSIISREAWCTVLCQALRCFVASDLYHKRMSSLPGINKEEEEKLSWKCAGNFYDVAAHTILKWITYHVQQQTNTEIRVISFDQLTKESAFIGYLLKAHVPWLVDSHLSELQYSPGKVSGSGQNLQNAKMIMKALKCLFSDPYTHRAAALFNTVSEDLVHLESVEMYLVCLYLSHALPHFVLKGQVDYPEAKVGDKLAEMIQIHNPTSKPLVYYSKLTGAEARDFYVEFDQITVAPRSTQSFTVYFSPCFARTSSAYLHLTLKRATLNNYSAFIFKLSGSTCAMSQVRTYYMESSLYQMPPLTVYLDVPNFFAQPGSYDAQIQKQYKLVKAANGANNHGAIMNTADEMNHVPCDPHNPLPFHVLQRLDGHHALNFEKANEGAKLPVVFSPFEIGHFECIIHVRNEKLGEFTLVVEGRASLPEVSETFYLQGKTKHLEKVIKLKASNPLRDAALAHHMKASYGSTKFKIARIVSQEGEESGKSEAVTYKVEYISVNSYAFKGPKQLTWRNRERLTSYDAATGALMAVKPSSASFPRSHEVSLSISPKFTGKSLCLLHLTRAEYSDHRTIQVEYTAT